MRYRTEKGNRGDLRKPSSKMRYEVNSKKSNVFPGALGAIGTLSSVTAGDGIDTVIAGTDLSISVDLKANGGLVIETTELAVDLGASNITGTLAVGDGGTGTTTLTDHGILLGSGTGAVTVLGAATHGQLPIGSTGADPVLATLTEGDGIDITNAAGAITIGVDLKSNGGLVIESGEIALDLSASSITGTLAVGDGGTGTTTLTIHGVVVGNAAGAVNVTAAGTTGQVLKGVTGGDPTFGTLAFTDIGSTPSVVTTTHVVLSSEDKIIANSTSDFTITLPAASGSGATKTIKNINAGNVTLEGNGSDTIDGSLNIVLVQWDSITVYDYAANSWGII